ncbi:MAG: hypothetical protein WHV26_15305 [Spirochaetota bacterium]
MKKILVLSGLLIFVLIIVPIVTKHGNAQQRDKKKLYISTISVEGLPQNIIKQVRNTIEVTIYEKFADYRVITDDDVRVMYRKAEQLMASGCNADSCQQQIADAIDADEILYGDLVQKGDLCTFKGKCLIRNRNTLTIDVKSVVQYTFAQDEMEYYIAEITKKLLNPAYAIVKKAVKQEFALPELKPLKQITIEPVQFKTDDQLAQIVSIIKEKINDADEYYKQRKYKKAIEVYNDIITRIETKLTGERKQKLLGIKDDVTKHRDNIYAAIYSERITQIDEQYKALKEGDVKQIDKIMQAYETIEEELSRIPDSEWLFQKQEIMKTVKQREIILYEVMGQMAFKQYDFTTAYDMMRKAFDIGNTISDDKNNYNIYYGEKLVIIRGTAENYITSRLQSLISIAEYYNFNDDTANAKKALNQAYSLLTGKQKPYVTQDVVEKYNTAAQVIGGTILTDKDIETSE